MSSYGRRLFIATSGAVCVLLLHLIAWIWSYGIELDRILVGFVLISMCSLFAALFVALIVKNNSVILTLATQMLSLCTLWIFLRLG